MMTLSRRGYLSATGSLAAGAVLPGLSACRHASASSLSPDIAGGWVGAQVERAHAWRDGHLPAASEGDPIRVHTLIIGAGVAGLSAARSLTSAGPEDIAVLDLEDQPGGNARGHQMQGLPCPLGAHYLPMPGDQAHEVAQWLEEIGLIRQVNGRWVGDERHLCHSPQERLFVPSHKAASAASPSGISAPSADNTTWWPGQWQEGLLPPGSMQDMAQYRRFAADVDEVRQKLGFAIPTSRITWNAGLDALDKLTFDQWLNQRGYTSPALRWLLDYACRDDYGAGTGRVSAWAGLHYFASRHGFELPGQADEPRDAVLTWPEGNGWLTRRLALGLGARWQGGQVVLSVDVGRHDVRVQSWSVKRQRTQTWAAGRVVLAVPLFVAHRLLRQPVPALQAVVPHMAYAPWLVSNVLLSKPFFDRPGAPLSWDNVPCTSEGVPGLAMPSLGYVDARHQSLAPVTGPMLLTHYWALGGQSAEQGQAQRQALLKGDWRDWAGKVAQDMARIHPDLPGLVTRIDLMRYGHAMAIPVPGLRGHAALAALQKPSGRLYFAHSDLSAYSVFEEAFTHGARAAHQVLAAAGMPRRMA
jgi:predicted NAD/FAD-dependent oxidoreductase